MNYFAHRVGQLLINKQLCTGNTFRCLSRSSGQFNQFKSVYALENLYPGSNQKIYTPTFTPLDPNAKFSGFIPMNEIVVTYSRSSGPGGMNVNSSNTKVEVRFKVESATWLSDELKEKLLVKMKSRINKDGYLIVRSETTRVPSINLADALQKMRMMIRSCATEKPTISEETEEVLRKRIIKASRERVFEKRKRSSIKQERSNCDL